MDSTIINKLTNLVEAAEGIFIETSVSLSDMIEFIDNAALESVSDAIDDGAGQEEVQDILIMSQSIRKLLIVCNELVKD